MIITLCGSNRFEETFKRWNLALSLAGHAVFTTAVYPSFFDPFGGGVKEWYTPEEKVIVDKVHLEKIEASDAIMVLNVCAYIGESTMNELVYAKKQGKKVYALESWGQGRGIHEDYHTEEALKEKAKYGIPVWYMSPITTTTNEGYCNPWADSLLGPAGRIRNRIVQIVKEGLVKRA